jgi:hypothetical protein
MYRTDFNAKFSLRSAPQQLADTANLKTNPLPSTPIFTPGRIAKSKDARVRVFVLPKMAGQKVLKANLNPSNACNSSIIRFAYISDLPGFKPCWE